MSDASCPSFEPFRCPEEGKCISIQVKRVSYSAEILEVHIRDLRERKSIWNFLWFYFSRLANGGKSRFLPKYFSLGLLSICVTEQTTVRMVTMKTNCSVPQVGYSESLQSPLYKLLEIFPSTPTSSWRDRQLPAVFAEQSRNQFSGDSLRTQGQE